MTDKEKDKWIRDFAISAMASYAAIKYDENCFVGWGKKEQYMNYEDAESLAQQAYKKKF